MMNNSRSTIYHQLRYCLMVAALVLLSSTTVAERLKDIVSIDGVRTNQLIGYGLVVGLNGTGDQTAQTPFTIQSFRSMLEAFGVTIPAGLNIQLENVAAVVVHADLPAFAKPGQRIDVTVSSIGNAESLRGGSLLFTPMKGADGSVYAIAQGNLVVGGFGASGADGSSIKVNIPSVGRIPSGATVERSVPSPFSMGESIILNLNRPDFTTALRVTEAINKVMGESIARSIDATSITIDAPMDTSMRVRYLSILENIEVEPAEAIAKVIVNSRTGTIVIGKNVRVAPAAVTHGNLSVTITEDAEVSQPNPLSEGATVVVPTSDVEVEQEKSPMFLFSPGVELRDIVTAVNQVGAAPGDLMAILEALKQAGALRAQLEVI